MRRQRHAVLIGVVDTNASRSDMNVSAGSFTGDSAAECVIRNSFDFQIPAQPDSLRLIGVNGYVDASSMVESKRLVNGTLTLRANGQGSLEFPNESSFEHFQILRRVENAAAVIANHALERVIGI